MFGIKLEIGCVMIGVCCLLATVVRVFCSMTTLIAIFENENKRQLYQQNERLIRNCLTGANLGTSLFLLVVYLLFGVVTVRFVREVLKKSVSFVFE
jgi:hypothetical protein